MADMSLAGSIEAGVWKLEAEEAVHAGAKIQVRWSAGASAASARRDFIALYTAGQTAKKYTEYKIVEKEGLTNGIMEFVAPAKPGEYFFRYLKADYTELARSATVVVSMSSNMSFCCP